MNQISGRQVAAARALADISQKDLADRARIPLADLLRLEAYGAALLPDDRHTEAIRNALESFVRSSFRRARASAPAYG